MECNTKTKIAEVKLANPTWGYARIAQAIGCSKNTVKYHLKEGEVTKNTQRHQKWKQKKRNGFVFVPQVTKHKCNECGERMSPNGKVCLKCCSKNRYEKAISDWMAGNSSGISKNGEISHYIRRWVFEKFDSKCCKCSWGTVHPITGKIPLQVDHIDGNWENNVPDNLQLLCPNCHSLTPFHGSLNKGRGRPWKHLYNGRELNGRE